VISSFDPGALLGASYQLPDGTRVRLRIVAPSDRPRVLGLLEASGHAASQFACERLLRVDPRCRAVVCATALVDGAEVMVGVGAIDLDRDGERPSCPDPLVIHPAAPAGLDDLLAGALLGRAQALARGRAA
jgi:hypothetical protein